MEHKLKTWPEYFEDLSTCQKMFEVRKSDRKFGVGDTLILQEWDPRNEEYTGREILRKVTYVLFAHPGIRHDYVVMGLKA